LLLSSCRRPASCSCPWPCPGRSRLRSRSFIQSNQPEGVEKPPGVRRHDNGLVIRPDDDLTPLVAPAPQRGRVRTAKCFPDCRRVQARVEAAASPGASPAGVEDGRRAEGHRLLGNAGSTPAFAAQAATFRSRPMSAGRPSISARAGVTGLSPRFDEGRQRPFPVRLMSAPSLSKEGKTIVPTGIDQLTGRTTAAAV
jgi:hypothetical protein